MLGAAPSLSTNPNQKANPMNQITRNDVTAIVHLTPGEDEALRFALGHSHFGSWTPPKGTPSYGDVVRGCELVLTAAIEVDLMIALASWRAMDGQSSARKAGTLRVWKKIDGALDREVERVTEQAERDRAVAQAKFDSELRKIADMRADADRGFVAPDFKLTFSECYDRRHMEWSVEDASGVFGHARRWDIRMHFSVVDSRPVVRYDVDAPMLSATEWEHNRRVLCDSYDEMLELVELQSRLFGAYLTATHLERFEEMVSGLAYLDAMAAELVTA